MAPRISPGRTNGTRRRAAQGCSGEMAGRQSTVTMTHSAMSSGSAQVRAVARGSVQVSRDFTPRLARTARPKAPSSTAGRPMYQITQYRLFWSYWPGVLPISGRTAKAAKTATVAAAAASGSQDVSLWLARSRLSWFSTARLRVAARAAKVRTTTAAAIRPSGRSEGPTRSR